MTNEQKIISLARDKGFEDMHAPDQICVTYNEIIAFYQRVRDEALEEAADKCAETREIDDHWDGGTTPVHKCFYRDDCIAAIRSMKETK